MQIDELLRGAREGGGRSMREVATLAGLAPSTVSRLERGLIVDPTIRTLSTILEASGVALRWEPVRTLRHLSRAVDRNGEPDFMLLANWADGLRKRPWQAATAISLGPDPDTDQRLANLLAAMAEKTADDHGLPRPEWCSAISPLRTPWESPGTNRHRERAREEAPQQFRDRQIFLSSTNIWRRTGAFDGER